MSQVGLTTVLIKRLIGFPTVDPFVIGLFLLTLVLGTAVCLTCAVTFSLNCCCSREEVARRLLRRGSAANLPGVVTAAPLEQATVVVPPPKQGLTSSPIKKEAPAPPIKKEKTAPPTKPSPDLESPSVAKETEDSFCSTVTGRSTNDSFNTTADDNSLHGGTLFVPAKVKTSSA